MKRIILRATVSALALAALSLATGANASTPVTINNDTFGAQAPPFPLSCYGAGCTYTENTPITGWTYAGGGEPYGVVFWNAPTATNYYNYTPTPNTVYTDGGSIYQTLSAKAIAGATYTFTVYAGLNKQLTSNAAAYLDIGYDGSSAQTSAAIELLAEPTTSYTQYSGNWVLESVSYTVPADLGGYDLQIDLYNSAVGQGDFSDPQLSYASSAPEPATWATLVVGLGAVGGLLRGRRQRTMAVAS
jgi:hypothetical protein